MTDAYLENNYTYLKMDNAYNRANCVSDNAFATMKLAEIGNYFPTGNLPNFNGQWQYLPTGGGEWVYLPTKSIGSGTTGSIPQNSGSKSMSSKTMDTILIVALAIVLVLSIICFIKWLLAKK